VPNGFFKAKEFCQLGEEKAKEGPKRNSSSTIVHLPVGFVSPLSADFVKIGQRR
jgi:hypothetical protein